MPLTKLQFKPGINREGTNYSNEGGWFDGDKIRFKSGYVERIGGWERVAPTTFLGSCRCQLNFTTLGGENLLFMGTHKKAYLEDGGQYYDITPYAKTINCGVDPITTGTAGSGIITVDAVAHGSRVGDYVTISGAVGFDGITDAQLNQNFEILTVPTTDSFTVDTGGSATAGATAGGGSSVVASMEIPVGLDVTILGNGWGAGTWGRFTWGSGAGSLAGQNLRLWFGDSWGEDIVSNLADGKIYYWDASTGLNARMVDLSSVAGASDVPVVARKVLVSDVDRHVLCFGTNAVGSSTLDPLLIRWSSQESVTDWTPTALNTAGDLRLSQGSEIITAIRTSRQTLVWTESTLHSVQYIGPPYTFGTAMLGANIRIAGPNTAIAVNDIVFWMGQDNFYVYDGRIQQMPCSVNQYVFSDMNRNQSFKFHAGSLSNNSEIWWFYCSADSDEIDRYVIFNYLEKVWYYGTLSRTAWTDRGAGYRFYPQASGTDGVLYNHEYGLDDGTTNPPTAINAYVQSADFDIGEGQQFMLINRILPDLNFHESTATSPEVSFVMAARNYNGNVRGTSVPISLTANPITTSTAGSGIITVNAPSHEGKVGDYVTLAGSVAVDGVTAAQINQRFRIATVPTVNLTTNAIISGAAGSGVVTVTSAAHGLVAGDFVEIEGAQAIDGITAAQINQRLQIVAVPTANTFTVNTGGAALVGSVPGGGAVMSYKLGTFTVETKGAATVGSVTGGGASVTITFETSGDAVRTAIVNGSDNYTDQMFVRLRGRQMNLKVESNDVGVDWRLGAPRLDMRPDGRR